MSSLHKPILQVELGSKHICVVHSPSKAITKKYPRLKCWGQNQFGQAHLPKNGKSISSTEVIVMLSLGFNHTCRITSSNSRCWGSNAEGQSDIPLGYEKRKELMVISAGGFHTCALDQGSNVLCWGSNLFGQTDSGD
mmetsp:Transcript_57699/g.48760  ORF Transcript_57699/g.48760 Transcript_57699/m.48760 type:complete len:137 (+) Transcript_57699:410-820(+)